MKLNIYMTEKEMAEVKNILIGLGCKEEDMDSFNHKIEISRGPVYVSYNDNQYEFSIGDELTMKIFKEVIKVTKLCKNFFDSFSVMFKYVSDTLHQYERFILIDDEPYEPKEQI